MATTVERLAVEVDANTSKAEKGLNKVNAESGAMGKIMGEAKKVAAGFGVAAVAGLAGKTIMAASDLNETLSKTGVVFGDQTSQVTSYAQQMADKFGLPKTAVLDAASSFGLLGKAAGLSGGSVAKMSTNLAGLAADASSFYNVPLDQALEDFRSGLTGEAEPLRKYGVLINEAAVQTQALAMGIVKPVTNTKKLAAAQLSAREAQQALTKAIKEHGPTSVEAQKAQQKLADAQDKVAAAAKGSVPQLTEGQKVQARAALITKGLADANGDLSRTQTSVSNRMRELKGRVANAAADFGTKLLPATAAVLGGLVNLFDYMGKAFHFIGEHQTAFKALAAVLLTIFGPALIKVGVTAVASGAKAVASFVAQRAAAAASAAAQWKSFMLMVKGWVVSAAQAARSAAQTVILWAMYKREAAQGAAAQVAAQARIIASWVAMKVQAMANAAQMATAWVIGIIRQAAVAAAAMAATAARVVAGWVLMGVQSLIQAARMAAAWVIAMGPVGWVIAAVVALVALIIANWDTVKRVTAAAWGWVAAKSQAVWAAITGAISTAVNVVKAVVRTGFALVKAYVTTYVNLWRAVISAAWRGIMAVVSGAVNAVKAYVRGWAAIVGWIKGYWDRAVGAVRTAVSTLLGVVRGIPGRIKSSLGHLGSLLYDSGKSIIQGLIDGIRNMAGNVYGAVKDVLAKARNLLPFSPAKEGPFSGKGWTLYSGRSIGQALAAGLAGTTGEVRKAALGAAQAAVPPVGGLTVPGVAVEGGRRAQAGAGGASRALLSSGAGAGTGGAPLIGQQIIYYPKDEATSQATNRGLQRVAALPLG